MQVRPELNLGHYTDLAFGIDFGKVMNVEGVIDHLAYTDVNSPSNALVNDDDLGLSIVGGITGRAVLYNYHLNGVYGAIKGNFYSFEDTVSLSMKPMQESSCRFIKKSTLSTQSIRAHQSLDLVSNREIHGERLN